jgi:hypothetical protein
MKDSVYCLTEDLAKMFAWAAAINALWAADPEGALSADATERLRKWIERLLEKLRRLVKALPEVQSFSMSAPPVVLTVTFAAPE